LNHRRFISSVISLLLITFAAHAQTYIFGRADFAVGSVPTSIASGDFNGDGITDLAVTNSNDNTVSILLGNPDGTFAPQVTYATGPEPVAVVTGDFNGDGNLDLAVSNGNCQAPAQPLAAPVCGPGTVSILLGNGDGTFQPHLDYSVGSIPTSVVAADFNGDGKLDLGVANANDSTVSVLLGNGDGTFQAQVVYTVATSSPYLQSVVMGDFNGDGKLDLAVSCFGGVSVLLGKGDGTFQSHRDSVVSLVNGYSLAAGDFNQDGKLDLAVTSVDGLVILLGIGDGTFFLNDTYAGGSFVTAADVNGDGKLDLVVSQGGDEFQSPYAAALMLGNGDGSFQTPVVLGTGSLALGSLVTDINGDGKLDLVFADSGCGIQSQASCSNPPSGIQPPPGAISVLLGLGNGNFVGTANYGVTSSSLTSADFNGDGKLDLATVDQSASASVLLGNGNGTFQAATTYATATDSVSITTGDFGNNGIQDLVTANPNCTNTSCPPGTVSVLLGNGNGTFQPNVDYGVGLSPELFRFYWTREMEPSSPRLRMQPQHLRLSLQSAILTETASSTWPSKGALYPSCSEMATVRSSPTLISLILGPQLLSEISTEMANWIWLWVAKARFSFFLAMAMELFRRPSLIRPPPR